MDGYLLDTNILAYWYDNSRPEHQAVMHRISTLPDGAPLWISVVTLAEIEYGHQCSPQPDRSDQEAYEQFVNKTVPRVANIDQHTVRHYGSLRARLFKKFAPNRRRLKWPEELVHPTTAKQLGVQENDIWIAAQALQFNFILVTNDQGMFSICKAAPELQVENWTKIAAT